MTLARVEAILNGLARDVAHVAQRRKAPAALRRAIDHAIEEGRFRAKLAFQRELTEAAAIVVENELTRLAAMVDYFDVSGVQAPVDVGPLGSDLLQRAGAAKTVHCMMVPNPLAVDEAQPVPPRTYSGLAGRQMGIVIVDGAPSIASASLRSLVLHEFAHAIDPIVRLGQSWHSSRRRAAELLCDGVALAYGGPAFGAAMSRFRQVASGPAFAVLAGDSHPPFAERMDFMCWASKEIWEAWVRQWVDSCLGCGAAPGGATSDSASIAVPFLKNPHPFQADVIAKVKTDVKTIKRLKERQLPNHPLARGIAEATGC